MKNTPLYIAFRYLVARKGSTAVTFITWLAASAMMVAVASMLVIVSVFSGLEDLNNEMIKDLHSDLTIKSSTGKTLPKIGLLEEKLNKNKSIKAFSKIIEEKVFVEYDGTGDIARLRGVDEKYTSVNPIDKGVVIGEYPSFNYENEALMDFLLSKRLSIPIGSNTSEHATLYMPKAGKGLITQESDIFNKKEIYITGVFPGKDQMNSFIISPIELTQNLLNLPQNTAYEIVIRLHENADADKVRHEILQSFGNIYTIVTKKEQNAAFWKMINIEKLFVYLIFALVIFITTFNLAGAIIILKLDKKPQAKALLSLGLSENQLTQIYFYTGILIVFCGIASGLLVGTITCLFQIQTNFFMANSELPFPIKLMGKNYIYIIMLSSFFGICVSWLFSKVKKVLK